MQCYLEQTSECIYTVSQKKQVANKAAKDAQWDKNLYAECHTSVGAGVEGEH